MENLGALVATVIAEKDYGNARTARNAIRQCGLLSGRADESRSQEAILDALKALNNSKKEASKLNETKWLLFVIEESSSQLLIEHLKPWTNAFTSHLRGQEAAENLKISCWHGLRLLYARLKPLIDLPGVRKEASQGTKDVVNLITSTSTGNEPLLAAQWQAVAVMLQAVAPSFKACSSAVEKQLLENMLFANTLHTPRRLAASQVLALLPQATGDAGAWSIMMQRLILSSHLILDGLFLGLEGDTYTNIRASFSPGIVPLGGDRIWQASGASAEKERAWLTALSGLLDCMERMLTDAQPWPVSIPTSAFFTLAARLLSFTGKAGQPVCKVPTSASAYLELVGALPSLHAASLKLLRVWLRAGATALTPYFASVSRLLTDLLGRSSITSQGSQAAWQVRQEIYHAAADLASIAGRGATRNFMPAALIASVNELLPKSTLSELAVSRPNKKRKKSRQKEDTLAAEGSAAALEAAKNISTGEEADRSFACITACLGLLENILKVDGDAMSKEQRLQVDLLILRAAKRSSNALQTACHRIHAPGGEKAASFHLSCLRALHTSVIVPSQGRPAFLPQAVSLYKEGLRSSNAGVAAFCSTALSSCEAFLHPRTSVQLLLPLQDKPLLAGDVLRSSILKEPISSGGGSAKAVAGFAAPAAIQSLPIRTSALARSEPHKKEEQEEPLTQSEGKVGGKSASFSMSEAAIDGHPGDIKGMVKQTIPEAAAPLVAETTAPNAADEEQKAPVTAPSALDTESLIVNHSTMNGSDSQVGAPKIEVGSNGLSGLSKSVDTRALLMGESSDSEGPLPEIDLGVSSEDESETET